MSDRPVSLRAVLSELAMVDAIPVDDHSRIVDRLRALPTFAPATPDALTIPDHFDGQSPTHWVTLLLGHNPVLGALYDYADAFAKGYSSVRIDEQRNRLIAEADKLATPPAPTKPPREMPAPEPGMAYELANGECNVVVGIIRGWTWIPIEDPDSIVRIYWPGPTPVVIWERA